MIDDNAFNSIVTTAGAVLVAFITGGSVRTVIRRRRRKRRDDVDIVEREAVEAYVADPGRFVHDLNESNRQLAEEVKGYRREVGELRTEMQQFRDKDRKFRAALARWFVDIMSAFEQNHIDMPYPRDGDQDLLADVIPSALEGTRPRPPRPNPTL